MKLLISISLLAILFVIACKNTGGDPEKVITDPLLGDPISFDDASRLVRNYESRAHRPDPKGVSELKDTRCIWFSVKQVQAFINQIKKDPTAGIRFYLAAYDKDETHGLCPDKYKDLSTLVLVSTYDVTVTRGGKLDTLHYDYYNKTKRIGATLTATPENRGELCPPPEKCKDEGATLLQ